MLLEFKNVTKIFGNIEALKNISFCIEEGELVFITGPSGAGKTTILKLLIRQIKPSSGEIIFDGKNLNKLKSRDIPGLRQNIGIVFQDFKLLTEKTIRENCNIALAISGVRNSEWIARTERVFEMVDLGDRADLFPSQLSGGELQRAALARALVVNPKIIFADEPTGNLDWDTAGEVMKILQKIHKEGKTVIVTTHHKKIIKEFAGRVLVLKKGELIEDIKP